MELQAGVGLVDDAVLGHDVQRLTGDDRLRLRQRDVDVPPDVVDLQRRPVKDREDLAVEGQSRDGGGRETVRDVSVARFQLPHQIADGGDPIPGRRPEAGGDRRRQGIDEGVPCPFALRIGHPEHQATGALEKSRHLLDVERLIRRP